MKHFERMINPCNANWWTQCRASLSGLFSAAIISGADQSLLRRWRCFQADHVNSNYAMMMLTLFLGNAVRNNNVIYRMEAAVENIETSAR